MTNFEYWKDEILKITATHSKIAMVDDKPISCSLKFDNCVGCKFSDNQYVNCDKARFEWLYAEHVEKPKLTKKERLFCELVETGWIARDCNWRLCLYGTEKPKFNKSGWGNSPHGTAYIISESWPVTTRILEFLDIKFDFIEPGENGIWTIEDLLKLEVEA